MIRITSDMNIPESTYQDLLSEHGHIYVDRDKLSMAATFYESRSESYAMHARNIISCTSRFPILKLVDEVIYNWLIEDACVKPVTLKSKNVKGYSLAAPRLRKASQYSGMASEFSEAYLAHTSAKTIVGTIRGFVNRSEDTDLVNKEGVNISRLPFEVTLQQNLRFYYRNSDIIGIPKKVSNSVTVPDGYFLAWGDFASADMIAALNLYFIETERDREIARMYPKDGYAIFAHLMAEYRGEPFNYQEFLKERELYKLYALKTIYGNDYGENKEEKDFIKTSKEFMMSRARYRKYIEQIRKYAENSMPISMERYLGGKDILDRTSDRYRVQDMINKALNTPIQTHTSERIVMLSLAVKAQYDSLGYTYGKDWWIYYVRHDEPIFILSEEMRKDLWVFGNSSELLVDDGIIQYVDWYFGYNYTDNDEGIEKGYRENCIENEHRYTSFEPVKREQPYTPLKPLYEGALAVETVGGITYGMYYIEDIHSMLFFGIDTNNPRNAAIEVVDRYISKRVGALPGSNGIIIYNDQDIDSSIFLENLKEEGETGGVAFIRHAVTNSEEMRKVRKYLNMNLGYLASTDTIELPDDYVIWGYSEEDKESFNSLGSL